MEINGTNFKLEEYRRYASPAEASVLDFVVGDVEGAAGLTVRELADACGASVSTIMRLVRKLGYHGYRDFQQALIYDLAARRRSARSSMGDVGPGDSTRSVIHKLSSRTVHALDATAVALDVSAVDRAAYLVGHARSVVLFGMGASQLVAEDLALKLLRANIPCVCNADWHAQLLAAKNIGPDDVAVAFSYSGETAEVVECARRAKGAGAPVISVTAAVSGHGLLPYTDVALCVAASEHGLRSGAMASRIAQLHVVDVLFTVVALRDYDAASRRFAGNYHHKALGETD